MSDSTDHQNDRKDLSNQMKGNKTEKDEHLFPESIDFDDNYLDLYGESTKREFRKEYLERQHDIYEPPNYRTKGMVILTVITEIVIFLHLIGFILITYDNEASRKEHSDTDIKVPILNEGCTLNGFMDGIDRHAIPLVLCFTCLMHQSLILQMMFDFCGIHQFNLWVLLTRLSPFICFYATKYRYLVSCSENEGTDSFTDTTNQVFSFGTGKRSDVHAIPEYMVDKVPITSGHRYSGYLTGFMLWMYVLLNLLKVVLAMTRLHCLYNIRYIGPVLLKICQTDFQEGVLHVLNIMGLVSIITGYYDMFYWHGKTVKSSLIEDSNVRLNTLYYGAILSLLMLIYVLVSILKSRRHVIEDHQKFITTSEFANILDAMDGKVDGKMETSEGLKETLINHSKNDVGFEKINFPKRIV